MTDLFPSKRERLQDLFDDMAVMCKWRGWRIKDTAILAITALIHILVFPLRLARVIFAITFTPGSFLGKKVREGPLMRLGGWFEAVGCCPIFNCIVVADSNIFVLRKGIDTCGVVYWARERAMKEVFVPNEGEVVIDVGANIGSHTIPTSRLVGSQGKVIAVEAEPSNFDALMSNMDLNHIKNVIPVNLAAWNKDSTLQLNYTPLGTSHTLVLHKSTRSIKVKAKPVDKILDELGIEKVNWIKIDVEGAEVEVLAGLRKTITSSPNIKILVEVHTTDNKKRCLSVLKDSTDEVYSIDNRHIFASRIH